MTFSEYLVSKKIDSEKFRQADPAQWQAWAELFAQLHPNSFTAQKLYLINPIRRKYPLPADAPTPGTQSAPQRPAVKIKPKTGSHVPPDSTQTPAGT
jgi:hypothetical protein